MQAALQSLSNGPNLRLDKPITLIGRSEECDWQLNSTKISRRHCVIANIEGRIVIRDLDSTNGVRINGERQNSAELHHGDELTIGNFLYRVSICEDPTQLPIGNLNVSSEVPMPLEDHDGEDAPVAKKAGSSEVSQ